MLKPTSTLLPPASHTMSTHSYEPFVSVNCRFGFFCGAALEYLKVRDVKTDILHCHDWQSDQ